ncbi:hypothetical protein VC83_01704 [Pseudogymnoascus destructans]|uniref:Sialidase domain-containing protein n=2 Tax=Pseudogymnoascus destructans TaxID=655981 RepID=L8FUG1_PSED2|nr:uncharacterized protein VC83_01704 [Pseudogymnoascus destructans]ELR03391.1 hypothetical protein GMDG_06132 [Pseudogymnoascus destructans 20631-21]OAF61952.1 hypothetical protein VC83_01704 [Pseudogymnoascus destructans]
MGAQFNWRMGFFWQHGKTTPPNRLWSTSLYTKVLIKGETWAPFSTVTDLVNGWGLRYQPDLYLLPQAIGKGTVICSAYSIPTDLSQTKIDVYPSVNGGKTWSFLSTVASGGVALSNNGETPIWEPFMMVYDNQLVMYYSDQRDPAYGQKIVHEVSADGVTWGPVVNDIAYSTYEHRPRMPTVAALPNGQYIITYEYGLGPNPTGSGAFILTYYLQPPHI